MFKKISNQNPYIIAQRKAIEYANSNNPYKIGDIISDCIGSIKIEKIYYHIPGSSASENEVVIFTEFDIMPFCVFIGTELTNKMKLNKKGTQRMIYQPNIISKT